MTAKICYNIVLLLQKGKNIHFPKDGILLVLMELFISLEYF